MWGNVADWEYSSPDRELWLRKIAQAIWDASTPENIKVHDCSTKKISDDVRRKARHWLTNDSRDLRNVCDAAGVDFQAVLRRGRALAAQGWPRQKMEIEEAAA